MPGADFLLNVVLNKAKKLLGVFAGDMVQAHLAGRRLVRQAYGAAFDQPAGVVIARCGGYPKDVNLYQAQKTLDSAVRALKPGGQLILPAECPEGTGSIAYEEWACRYNTLAELEQALRENFQLGGHKAYAVSLALSHCGVAYLVSGLPSEIAHRLGFIPVASLDQAVQNVFSAIATNPNTYVIPQGSLIVPIG